MKPLARRIPPAMLLVPLGFMAALLMLPALNGIRLSFVSCGLSLANYRQVLDDPFFRRALLNNLLVPAGSMAIEFGLGLALALTLTARRRDSALLEAAAILPFALPEIVLLAVARFIFAPHGYINGALYGTGAAPVGWLTPGSALAKGTVMLVDAWHLTPVVMLILMAGLQTIPAQLYEAAMLDGAGPWQTFRHVTLPLLMPALIAALVLRGVDALRIFSTTLVLTGAEGVPVLSTYAYQLWSDAQEPRSAMAASVLLALLITLLGVAGLRFISRFAGEQVAP